MGRSGPFKFGLRIRTGHPDDPRSPHQTFGGVFNSWEFALDRAYLNFTPGLSPFHRTLALSIGKLPHAFLSTEGLWDDDVSPEGVAAEFGLPRPGWLDQVKLVGAAYIIDERNRGRDASMRGAQVQVKKSVRPQNWLTLAVGLYDYHHLGSIAASDSDRRENLVMGSEFASTFRVVDTLVKGDFAIGGVLVSPYVDIFHNTRAVDSARTGLWAGVSVGAARERGDWQVTYLYSYVERDATLAAVTQDDFLAGTNYQGHRIQFLYRVLDKVQVKPEVYTTRLLRLPLGATPRTEFTFRLNTEIRF